MELCNFSSEETQHLNRAIRFIGGREVDLQPLLARTLIVKTEHFIEDCKALTAYYPELGLEDGAARLVFNVGPDGQHKILVNKAAVIDLSYIHALATQMVHLGNLNSYNSEHGNIYRLSADQAIADFYYEFLLWTRFQAMKIATRAHALVSWHAVNGEAPPVDGCYQFAQVSFAVAPLRDCLHGLGQEEKIGAWREGFWLLLLELTTYLGHLSFFQQTPHPAEVDDQFPALAIEQQIGLENCLRFYALLQTSGDYATWKEMRSHLRQIVVTMQEHGQQRLSGQA